MANDRMWLVHKPSGERALIAKTYGEGWYEWGPEAGAPRSIEKLLYTCGADDNKDFIIEYDSDPPELNPKVSDS